MSEEANNYPDPHAQIGNYELGGVVSQTVLGTFYQAVYQGKEVLLHFLPRGILDADPGFLRRYKSTLLRLKKVVVTNLEMPVDILEIDSYTFCHYDVSDLICLSELIDTANKEPLQESWARGIIKDVAESLKSARVLEVGHFFLMPDFVYVDGSGKVRLFGIGILESIKYEAFEYYISKSVSPFKDKNERLLTPLEILSPELRDNHKFDTRSDLYGVGILIYILLTGKKPVRNWVLPSKARADIEPNWDLLISHCLEPVPENRYSSWGAFLSDLNDLENLKQDTLKEDKSVLRRLEWIPLPGAIQKRYSEQLQMKIRLMLLGLMGLVSIGAATLLLLILFEEPPADIQFRNAKKVFAAADADIVLNIRPINSRVTLVGAARGTFIVSDGKLPLKTGKGTFSVKVDSPVYEPKVFTVTIDKAGESINRVVQLSIPWAPLTITSAPDTEVYVKNPNGNSLYLGLIDEYGILKLENRLLAESYNFIFSNDGYYDYETDAVELEVGVSNLVNVDLEMKPAQLTLSAVQAGVMVSIDGVDVGEVPLEITNIDPMVPLLVEVKKDGYRSFIRQLTLEPGSENLISAPELERMLGTVKYQLNGFTGGANSNALPNIIIGEIEEQGLEGELRLPAGDLLVRVQHPDYEPIERSLYLEDRETSELSFKLVPLPAQLTLGLETKNPIFVLVNGKLVNVSSDNLELQPNVESEVEIRVRDYLVVKKRFQPQANEKVDWQIPLKRIPGPELGKAWNPPYFDLALNWIPKGQYMMGTPRGEIRRLPNEDSLTRVLISQGFWGGKFEVTQVLYERVTRSNPSAFKADDFPVESVSWEQAVDFCRRITAFEKNAERLPKGYEYRLPTEAEWEYMVRYGNDTVFHFGDEAHPGMGNFKGSYPEVNLTTETSTYGPIKVGTFVPNALGLFDMHGNVAEWTLDMYWDRLPGGIATDYYRMDDGRGRSVRGGSWEEPAHRVRSGARASVSSKSTRNSIGFRVVLAPALPVRR